MSKTNLLSTVVVLLVAGWLISACGGSDVNIDGQLPGYWISSDSNGALYIDNDGYGWGYEIAKNGDLTVARLDWNAESLTTEATGPFGRLVKASGGVWEVVIGGEETSTGSYTLSTVISSGEVEHPFLTVFIGGTEYLVKVAELL
jgi:hypothetical protein